MIALCIFVILQIQCINIDMECENENEIIQTCNIKQQTKACLKIAILKKYSIPGIELFYVVNSFFISFSKGQALGPAGPRPGRPLTRKDRGRQNIPGIIQDIVLLGCCPKREKNKN